MLLVGSCKVSSVSSAAQFSTPPPSSLTVSLSSSGRTGNANSTLVPVITPYWPSYSKALCPTWHKIGHLGDVLCSQYLSVVLKKLNTNTHTPVKRPFVQDYPGEPVPEGKTNLDFTEARDNEWQWHQLGHMQVCTSLQTITMPAPHHSVFYRPDALPAAQPTASKHWRQKHWRLSVMSHLTQNSSFGRRSLQPIS